MKICVGSKNKAKLAAVKEALLLYDEYKNAEVAGKDVDSGVSEQPLSLGEIMKGSHTRAKGAFEDCVLSVGIESGLMKVPRTDSGYMDVTAVALYNGEQFYTGLSPGIQLPKRIVDIAIEKKIDLSVACKECGVTELDNIGSAQGFVGLFTGGRITRTDYTKHGFIMAMAHKEYHNL